MDTEEAILARHRAEKKDLQNKIAGMKKQATKSKRKQVNSRCEELEHDLLQRQEKELQTFRNEGSSDKQASNEPLQESSDDEITPEKLLAQLELGVSAQNSPSVDADKQQTAPQPKKRRNRQKERLAKRDAEMARIREAAAQEAAVQPNLKQIEQDALDQLCDVKGVKQFDIKPDGHCLFASILDQVWLRHPTDAQYFIPSGYDGPHLPRDLDVRALRSLSSNYIRQYRDDFVPYLFDEATMSIKDVDDYTKTMEETAQWGGEVELLALAKVLKCCISVMMSGRATHMINEQEVANPELKLVYYKHSFALGEHYNSLHDS
ncbi:deubiquitinase OTU2 [Lachancea thermotolerans CBS 6340]|uniref:KLTH0D07304p n=1 Tax=Lachancea thermotolerans (strain ATCC 56472 / CBS 6340 / NRRL Y-8284) TaxID=559295 RepID=C5DGQ8_LACTC|nr:KLTH0D07304p [Lachancea thermotolerans CBS 6340]CAR22600.1 KLTH0D07304p [Lachancea thermotolerans CBS 6340]